MLRYLTRYFVALPAFALVIVACEPDDDYLVDVDYSKATYLIQDNFNLSTFSAAIQRVGVDKVLLEDGPFTVLVPSNDALLFNGIGTDNVWAMPSATLTDMVNYHILEGYFELNKLPFLYNQELITRDGNPIYVTRWVKTPYVFGGGKGEDGKDDGSGEVREPDTLITINGGLLNIRTLPASNGLVMVLDRMLQPNVQGNVVDYMNDLDGVTLFAQAIRSAGLEEQLRGMGSCTIFAPSNAAMAAYGYPTVQLISQTDPEELATLVRYHVQEDRRFVNDFALAINDYEEGNFLLDYFDRERGEVITNTGYPSARGTMNARMLDGNGVTFTYAFGEVYAGAGQISTYRLSITDVAGEEAIVSILDKDFIARNGFIHVIDKVLKHTR